MSKELSSVAKNAAKALKKQEALTQELAKVGAQVSEYAKHMYSLSKAEKLRITEPFEVDGVKFSLNNSRGVARLALEA